MTSQILLRTDCRIRAAGVGDIPAMLDVQRAAMMELAAASYNPMQILALLRHNADSFHDLVDNRRALFFTRDFKIVGCAAWCPLVEAGTGMTSNDMAEIRSVYVHPDCARQGIARLLLMQVERRAREAGM